MGPFQIRTSVAIDATGARTYSFCIQNVYTGVIVARGLTLAQAVAARDDLNSRTDTPAV